MTTLVNKWVRIEEEGKYVDRYVTGIDQYGIYLDDGNGNNYFVSHSVGIKCQILKIQGQIPDTIIQ